MIEGNSLSCNCVWTKRNRFMRSASHLLTKPLEQSAFNLCAGNRWRNTKEQKLWNNTKQSGILFYVMCLQVITPEAWAPVKLLIMWGSCIFVQFVIFVTPFSLTFVTVTCCGNEWLLKEKSESAKKVYDKRMLWNFKLYKINILHSTIHS